MSSNMQGPRIKVDDVEVRSGKKTPFLVRRVFRNISNVDRNTTVPKPKSANNFTSTQSTQSNPHATIVTSSSPDTMKNVFTATGNIEIKFTSAIPIRVHPFIFCGSINESDQSSVSVVSKTKMPDFSLIHQRMFKSMESIDETLKRRIERLQRYKRESAAKKQKQGRGPKANTPESHQNVAQIRQKQHQEMFKSRFVTSSVNKRDEILRGVRFNRRFDIQMKFREDQAAVKK